MRKLSALLLACVLAACSNPAPPVWDPPPKPTPAPVDAKDWAAFEPLLLAYAAGTPVSMDQLDKALGAHTTDRVDPLTTNRVVEYRVAKAGVTLSVYAHFPGGATAKASLLNVR